MERGYEEGRAVGHVEHDELRRSHSRLGFHAARQ